MGGGFSLQGGAKTPEWKGFPRRAKPLELPPRVMEGQAETSKGGEETKTPETPRRPMALILSRGEPWGLQDRGRWRRRTNRGTGRHWRSEEEKNRRRQA